MRTVRPLGFFPALATAAAMLAPSWASAKSLDSDVPDPEFGIECVKGASNAYLQKGDLSVVVADYEKTFDGKSFNSVTIGGNAGDFSFVIHDESGKQSFVITDKKTGKTTKYNLDEFYRYTKAIRNAFKGACSSTTSNGAFKKTLERNGQEAYKRAQKKVSEQLPTHGK